ncbi:MAG: YitT family protein [Lachnospiraceae bacterium]|nr:YitT family protein [Lachnospiraceae bacterium]
MKTIRKIKKNNSALRITIEVAETILGSLMYAVAITLFLSPHDMAPGGVAGISIIINHAVPKLSIGVLMFAINLPLLVLGLVKLGKKFMLYTILSTVTISGGSELFSHLGALGLIRVPMTETPILASLIGGAIMGVGLGIVMRGTGSSGGTDIIIRVMRLRFKHVKTGSFYVMTDFMIILVSAIVFGNLEVALYAAIADVICSILLDRIIYGSDEAKLLLIISEQHEPIAVRLMAEVDTGVTYLSGSGGYTGENKKVLMCALHKSDFTRAREIVREVDPDAFLIVSSASEVFGEGYKGHYSEDL